VTVLTIRQAVEADAPQFLSLWNALDTETEFMLFEPTERNATLEDKQTKLAASEHSDDVHILVLDNIDDQSIAGFCAGRRSDNIRDKHTLHIVIGIRQHFTNKGWGKRLLIELERWAVQSDVSRLELSVMKNNDKAIALYESVGFVIEGTKKNSVCLRSGFVDEFIMAKLI